MKIKHLNLQDRWRCKPEYISIHWVQIDKKGQSVNATHVPRNLINLNLNSAGLIKCRSEPKKTALCTKLDSNVFCSVISNECDVSYTISVLYRVSPFGRDNKL